MCSIWIVPGVVLTPFLSLLDVVLTQWFCAYLSFSVVYLGYQPI